MATTANDLIEAALRDLNVLAEGEDASADESSSALEALNRLLDQWKTERLRMYSIVRNSWTIVASQASYTVGTGGDINIDRPVFVDDVNFLDTTPDPDVEYELNRLTPEAYAAWEQKARTATYPTAYYYDTTFSSGLATLYLLPIPTSSTLTGLLYARDQVDEFSATTSTVSLPPGYERMLIKELALELAPSYGREPSGLLLNQARQARDAVEKANVKMRDVYLDSGSIVQSRGRYGYSILRG